MNHKIELKDLQGLIPGLPATGEIKRIPRKRKKQIKKRIHKILEWTMENEKLIQIIEGLDDLTKEFEEVHVRMANIDNSDTLKSVSNVLDDMIEELQEISEKQNEE
jgi:hypothetical protein